MTATDNKPLLKKMRKKFFEEGIKYGVYENEKGLYVFIAGVGLQKKIEEFKEWFKDFNVNVYKSSSEYITIEIL